MMFCEGCGNETIREGFGFWHIDGSPACPDPDGIVRTRTVVGDDERRCDFCNHIGAVNHFIVTREIAASLMAWKDDESPSSVTFNHSDDWAICEGCAVLAQRRDFLGIVDRFVEQSLFNPEHEAEIRSGVGQLHSEVWQAWDGIFHPWT
jgi:hypothetical protein